MLLRFFGADKTHNEIELLDIFNKGDINDRITNATNEIRQRAFEYVKPLFNFSMVAEKSSVQISHGLTTIKTYCVLGSAKKYMLVGLNNKSGYVENITESDSMEDMEEYIDECICNRSNVDSFDREGKIITCYMDNGRDEVYMIVDCE